MKIINIKPITSKPLIALAILIIAVILVYFYYSFTSVSTDQDADFLAETSAVVVSSKPLKKGHAILHVTSEPDGAEIYLDKRLLGKTPFQSDDLPAGEHEIILTHANTYNYKEIVNLKDDVVVKKDFSLKYAFSSVTIRSFPESAHIIIDGIDTGLITPATLRELVGEHYIKLRKDGYYPKEATFTILKGITSVEEFRLEGGSLLKHKGEWVKPEKKSMYVEAEERALRVKMAKNRNENAKIKYADRLRKLAMEKADVGDIYATSDLLSRAQRSIKDSKLDEEIMSRARQQFNSVEGLFGQMVVIPGGTFQMGSISGDRDEQPVHKVRVRSFKLGQYEVTQAQWLEIMANNPSSFKGCDNCPVENVSWVDIQEFLKKLNKKTGQTYRLPLEAEWEYACRSGGKDELYCGGSSVYASAWYGKNSAKQTHPVKKKNPNGLGLYDMNGNVWEWTDDCLNTTYNDALMNGYASKTGDCNKRVLRGGSWLNAEWNLRSTDRSWFVISQRSYNLGFRLAQDY